MRITFITPPYSISERYHTKAKINKGYLPPLGLASIATVLKEAGHQVSILDLQIYDYTLEQIKEHVKRLSPELIAISAITPTIDKAYLLAKELKQVLNIPIVFGGLHPTMYPEKTLEECSSVDIVVIGEAEYTFRDLAKALENKKPLKNIKGICYKDKKGKIIRTARRPLIMNLDELPIPSREFFEMEKYVPLPNQYKVLPVTNMMVGRGCPYGQCTFCFEAGDFKPLYRRVTVKRAIEEIKMLVNTYGIKEISFWDDVFMIGTNWTTDFFEALKKENINIKWSCYGYFNYLNKDMLMKAKEAGCWNIFFGIEAGNQMLLDTIKKGFTLDKAREVIKWTKEAGIETRGSFILGLPNETPALAKETIDFAIELDVDYAQFTLNTPFPSTEMWKTGKEYGTINTNFAEYSVHNPVFLPHGYKSKEELQDMQKLAYRKFYFRPRYILKKITSIRSMTDIQKYAAGLKFLAGMS
jgi:radical SAM superfamily enzyme YgiQ (UPF0313 family)